MKQRVNPNPLKYFKRGIRITLEIGFIIYSLQPFRDIIDIVSSQYGFRCSSTESIDNIDGLLVNVINSNRIKLTS